MSPASSTPAPARAFSGLVARLGAVVFAITVVVLSQPPPASAQQASVSPVMSREAQPCGITSLQDLKWTLRGEKLGPDIARAMSAPEVSMAEIQEAAAKEGMALAPLKMSWDDVSDLGVPLIAHFESGGHRHFCVVEVGVGWVRFPGVQGVRVLPFHEVEPQYTGHALVETSAVHRELASPLIPLPASLADLGGVPAGRLITRSFPLHNTTGQTVKVADVICPADCQARAWPGPDIVAGGNAWLTVTWRPKSDPGQPEQQRHFLVVTDHPARRIYICSLLATVTGTLDRAAPGKSETKEPGKPAGPKP